MATTSETCLVAPLAATDLEVLAPDLAAKSPFGVCYGIAVLHSGVLLWGLHHVLLLDIAGSLLLSSARRSLLQFFSKLYTTVRCWPSKIPHGG